MALERFVDDQTHPAWCSTSRLHRLSALLCLGAAAILLPLLLPNSLARDRTGQYEHPTASAVKARNHRLFGMERH
jgi:hypothetical protein